MLSLCVRYFFVHWLDSCRAVIRNAVLADVMFSLLHVFVSPITFASL